MEMILENLPMALCVLLGMGLILVEVFLPGFGLPGISGIALVGVGTIMAAMHFGTLDKLMAATEDELMAIPDVGPTTAAYLRAWFANPQSQHQIRLLRAAGVSFESREQVVDHRFAGKTFVLTGALEHFSRDEAGAIIERFGGKTSSSVSKKTSYLLAGENTGSKYQKALTLGTPIITEAEFLAMIQE